MDEDWLDGRQAYADGDDESDCPPLSPSRRKMWLQGYNSAKDEDDSDDRLPDD